MTAPTPAANISSPESVREAERLRKLDELRAEWGGGFEARFGPGSLGRHEVLHAAGLIESLAGRELLDHPACVRDPALFAAATRAVDALAELYQAAGRDG